MKFCSECGHPVSQRVPEGDDRLRFICDHCQTIHYQNPQIVVGCLPVYGRQVLLCRRAIEPRRGYWTLPAGFMENGETTLEGACRETWEEARARVENEVLYRLFDLPQINQVYMFYRAEMPAAEFAPGSESLEVRLFEEAEIPWDELAFPVVVQALKDFFADRATGQYKVRVSGVKPVWPRGRPNTQPG